MLYLRYRCFIAVIIAVFLYANQAKAQAHLDNPFVGATFYRNVDYVAAVNAAATLQGGELQCLRGALHDGNADDRQPIGALDADLV